MNIEQTIEAHSKMIYKIASFYKGKDIEDLYQVGVIGLIKAIKNYKEGSNAKFSTYAFEYVRGEILAYLKKDNNIKVSKEYYLLRKKYENARELMAQKMNRIPSKTEVCLFLEIDEAYMDEVLNATDTILSLDYEFDESDLYDMVSGECECIEDKVLVNELLDHLDEIERKIIELRYFYDYTQAKTAEIMGMSQIQVCRSEKKSILKLRKEVA